MTKIEPIGQRSLEEAKIVVLGANSALGRNIMAAAGPSAIAVVRNIIDADPSNRFVVVSDYGKLPAEVCTNTIAIVNCVGTTKGNFDYQKKVNVDIALSALTAAEQHGVPRFVHISSFAVYGRCQLIDSNTAEKPVNDYGTTKLMADRQLLSAGGVDVAVLRIPAIVGEKVPSKLSRLLKLWQSIRIMPVSRTAERSMITVEAAASAALRLACAEGPVGGIWLVADPQPVNISRLAQTRLVSSQKRLRAVPLPDAALRSIRWLFPALFDRLFASSVLAEQANSFHDLNLAGNLEQEIRRMIEK